MTSTGTTGSRDTRTGRNNMATIASVAGMNVLITGAAMGMGRIYAEKAVAEGAAAVVLWDIDGAALESTAASLTAGAAATGSIVVAHVVDLSDREAITATAARARAEVGDMNVVINNAGIIRGKYFWEHDPRSDIWLTMSVNALAVMYVTREFLPAMIAKGREARVVNVASAAGFVSNPRMSVYCGSKWAVTGWSDSVRLELELAGHHHVRVTTVNPTYVSTGMFDGAKSMFMIPILSPVQVTDAVWRAMKQGSARLVMPWSVHLSIAVKGLVPLRVFDWLALNVFGIYKSMDSFKGRPS